MIKAKEIALDVIYILVGITLYSIALNVFFAPNNIAPGGVGGLSTIISYVSGIKIGLLNALINIPLFIMAYFKLGKRFVLTTGITTLSLSTMIELLSFITPFTEDRLLSAIFGGVIMGIGLGLILMRGSTSGGTDIVARILRRKRPHFSVGSLLFAFDVVIIVLAIIVYKDLISGFYATIAMYISTTVTDKMLIGLDAGKLVYIISTENATIAERITKEMMRGVTLLHGRRFFSGIEQDVIMVVIRRHQIAAMRRIVRETDPAAFMIFSVATETFGQGFKKEE